MTIGWSEFAIQQHTPTSGNPFTTLSHDEVIDLVEKSWDGKSPGYGETGVDRKVVVYLPEECHRHFFSPFVELTPDLPVQAKVTQRKSGEDFYVETFVRASDCAAKGIQLRRREVKKVGVVLYAADVLLENGGERSTTCEWEIVCLLASEHDEPMLPLTMARNYLEKSGGSFTDYSAREFAEAIYYHSTHRGIMAL